MTQRSDRGCSSLIALPLSLLIGVAIGIVVGLTLSWWLWPVEYIDVAPDSLRPSHRQEYLVLIGQAYQFDHNQSLAQSRLAALGDPSTIGMEVASLAEQYIAEGASARYIQALTGLAYALGQRRAALAPYLPEATRRPDWAAPATFTPVPTETPTETPTFAPSPTPTPTPTRTPTVTPITLRSETPDRQAETASQTPTSTPSPIARPTATPTNTAVPQPRYRLLKQSRICNSSDGLLRVTVLDVDGQPKPGVELLIRWNTDQDRFYTGLKPENGPGYADFELEKGSTYQLVVVGTDSDVATGIVADACVETDTLASWDVRFELQSPTP